MARKLFFILDANETVGQGHLSRCLHLKNILKDFIEIHFISSTSSKPFLQSIENCIYTDDLRSFILNKKNFENNIYLIDHYELLESDEIEKHISNHSGFIGAIIDLKADRKHSLDFIYSPAGIEFSKKDFYSSEKAPSILSGIEYFPSSQYFKNLGLRPVGEFRKSLICFGAADPFFYTEKTLEHLKNINPSQTFTVVGGKGFNNQRQKSLVENYEFAKFKFDLNQEELNQEMNLHNDAILSCSTIQIEAAKTGLPALSVVTAKNQEAFAANLIKEDLPLRVSSESQLLEDLKWYCGLSSESIAQKSSALSKNTSLSNAKEKVISAFQKVLEGIES